MYNPNIEIYFPDNNIFNLISSILIKNGLYETPSDIVDKDDSLIIFVLGLTKNFAREKLSEKEFIDSLQKKIANLKVAKDIFQEIKEKVLPLAEKVTIEKQIPEGAVVIEKAPISFTDISEKNPRTLEEKPAEIIVATPKEPEIKKTIVTPAETSAPKPRRPRGPDKYRESVE